MTKQMPNENDIVRVTLEGPARQVTSCTLVMGRGQSANHIDINAEHVKSIEIIERAKPEWWPLKNGDVFEYDFGGPAPGKRYVIGGNVFDDRIAIGDCLSEYNKHPERVTLKYRPEN